MRKSAFIPILLSLIVICPGLAVAQSETPPSQPSEQAPAEGDPAAELVEEVPVGPDLTEVNEMITEGAYAEADTALAGISEEFPENAGVQLMHGEVLLALRKTDEALEKLRRCAELDPERPRVHFQMAAALASMGKPEEAFEEFGKELEVNDNVRVLVLARLNRSMILDGRKDWAGSAAELEEALNLDPSQVQIYGDLVSLYIQASDIDKAREAMSRGTAAGFVSAPHYYSIGARLYADKRDEEAVEAFGQALAADPGLSHAERSIAAALERLGRKDEAVEHLRRYLELVPNAPDAAAVAEKIEEAGAG